MDKSEVKRVLVPYCPPLGPAQMEQIAADVEELSRQELEAGAPILEGQLVYLTEGLKVDAKAEAEKGSEKTPKKKTRSPKKKRRKVKSGE